MEGRGSFSTAEDQESFIVRISLKREVEKLAERKGRRQKDGGERVQSQNFPLFLETYNEAFLVGVFPIGSR